MDRTSLNLRRYMTKEKQWDHWARLQFPALSCISGTLEKYRNFVNLCFLSCERGQEPKCFYFWKFCLDDRVMDKRITFHLSERIELDHRKDTSWCYCLLHCQVVIGKRGYGNQWPGCHLALLHPGDLGHLHMSVPQLQLCPVEALLVPICQCYCEDPMVRLSQLPKSPEQCLTNLSAQ